MDRIRAVFFDLGGTLGDPVFSAPPPVLTGFDLYPAVADRLRDLRRKGLRLGIISNTGTIPGSLLDTVLGTAGIRDLFEADLRIYSHDVGLDKSDPAIFRLAIGRAGLGDQPGRCLFVGENVAERATAERAQLVAVEMAKIDTAID